MILALDKLDELYDRLTFVGRFIGCSMLEPNWKFNLRTLIPVFALTYQLILVTNSLYLFANDYAKILQVLWAFGLSAPGAVKFIAGFIYHEHIYLLGNFARNLYVVNVKNQRNNEILLEFVNKIKFASFVVFALFLIGFIIFITYPLYLLLVRNDHTWSIILMPFIDYHNPTGYFINICNQFGLVIIGLLGAIYADLLITCILISHYRLLIDLIEMSLIEFADTLRSRDNQNNNNDIVQYKKFTNRMNLPVNYEWLINIFKQYQEAESYLKTVLEVSKFIITFQVVFSVGALTIALFLIVVKNWVSGYGCALIGVTQLVLICFYGTYVEIAQNKSSKIIYNVPWYLLPVPFRKDILFLLSCAQKSKPLRVLPTSCTLNLELGLRLLKSTYQFLMVLLSFTK